MIHSDGKMQPFKHSFASSAHQLNCIFQWTPNTYRHEHILTNKSDIQLVTFCRKKKKNINKTNTYGRETEREKNNTKRTKTFSNVWC